MRVGLKGRAAAVVPQSVIRAAFRALGSGAAPRETLQALTTPVRSSTPLPGSPVSSKAGPRIVSRFSARCAREEASAVVLDALTAAQVEHRVLRTEIGIPAVMDVPAAQWSSATRAIAAEVGTRPFKVMANGETRPVTAQWPRTKSVVFEAVGYGRRLLGGPHAGVTLVPREAGQPEAELMTSANFPIDVVYTWVDGNDAQWRMTKAQAETSVDSRLRNKTAANVARYASRDELRYSLRSLDYFAPWVNHVYVVTAGQTPRWLNTSNSRITVVDHRDIFSDAAALPTFNSHAIESQLHHIDGLSEHFLYLNDDVFFGRPVKPELFFHGNGLAKFFLSEQTVDFTPRSADDLPVDSAAKNNRALLETAFGRTVERKFQHAAHPQRVSTLARLEQEHGQELLRTQRSKFRDPDDLSVASSLAHYYGFAIGAAVPGELSYRYCDINDPSAQAKLLRLLRRKDADVFCLNEVDSTGIDARKVDALTLSFLDAYFPVPGTFES
jgi:hypothetical protein